ncbi:MAG TPA: hypothetical protein O0X39_01465 [Methanocorpusculum sp.]|nr:hypothetical protein [Methanocorpusculum sp.]
MPQDTENTNSQGFIPCDGCGQYFKVEELKRCTDCGKVFCPDCRRHHVCDESDEAECSCCGKTFKKEVLMRCKDCGDILCPSCRKKHDCTGEKGESKGSVLPIVITVIVCMLIIVCVWICIAANL